MSNFKNLLSGLNFRVLIVDDTKSIHHDFKNIFTHSQSDTTDNELEDFLFDNTSHQSDSSPLQNISITSAYSGEEGIEKVKEAMKENIAFSVAIIDVRMPGGIDGVEAASKIFKIDNNIQVVICSAYNDYSWDQMINILSHNDRWVILKKPFDVIEARQMAVSLCQKWALLKDMKLQISEQTKELEQKVERLNKAKNEIYHLAYYDSLTQLPNRLFFNELLKQSISDAKKSQTLLGVLFVDLDNFKKINDTYGHQVGDQILHLVAERFSDFVRCSDVISRYVSPEDREYFFRTSHDFELVTASRFGGDEFTVLLRNFSSEKDLLTTAKRILQSIASKPFVINDTSHILTASIGLSIFPTDDNEPGKILKNADIAMYHAKKSGKNAVIIHNENLNKIIIRKNLIERAIPLGLKNNEFYLVYQPKISLDQRKIIGCEALIRWNNHEFGDLLPADFIAIAEESNLIVNIDKYVLDSVCKQLSAWKKTPLLDNLLTSINLSAKFFHELDAVETVKNILSTYDISPSSLEIEITETCLINSREQVAKCLLALQNQLDEKLRVAIDDFGVGYSSLNYLCDLPIDTVKIDKSFVQKINLDHGANSIVNSVIQLSHSLNHKVVAEGVESCNQLETLQTMKCDQIQGFLFAPPLLPDLFLQFVEEWPKNSDKNE